MDALADYHATSSEEEEQEEQQQQQQQTSPVNLSASSSSSSSSSGAAAGGGAAAALPSMAAMQARIMQRTLDICPAAPESFHQSKDSQALVLAHGQKELKHNPRYEDLARPLQGPNRDGGDDINDFTANTRTGHVQQYKVNNWAFMDEFDRFNHHGVATDVNGNIITNEGIENSSGNWSAGGLSSGGGGGFKRGKRKRGKNSQRRALVVEDDGSGGPWAKVPAKDMVDPEDRRTDLEKGTLTEEQQEYRKENIEAALVAKEETQEDRDREEAFKFTKGEGPAVPWTKGLEPDECKSIFHGEAEVDYQGRSWMMPPPEHNKLSDPAHKCFIPNKCVHTYTGHTKGVNCIKFIPGYANLLLSCSMDKKIKIWDVYNKKRCQRTYLGHASSVRDLDFNSDGKSFVSCSMDRRIKTWDTETGKCTGDFGNNKVPYCVRYHPKDDNVFLFGCSNKKILQYDIREGKEVQNYDHHLGPVNSILFVEDGKRMITTSDDKKVLIWDYGIPVPIKYISEPGMHSMPRTALHPSGQHWVGASMDNIITVWDANRRFSQKHKKTFRGPVFAGYAVQPSFSPNGQFMTCGDGTGQLWFWDWRTTKIYRKLRAHKDGPAIETLWHPHDPSRVVTCGWDGLIKMFE